MSKDLNELEALYEETLNERFEDLDNKAGSKEPFSKKSGPIVDGHDGVPVEDPEDADEDNAYEPKKFSQKRRKVVKDNINNFNMSKNADNIFDKLFFEKVYESQKKRVFYALQNSEPDSVIKFKQLLSRIIDGAK